MVARVQTVAFQGIEAVPVDVQAQIAPGLAAFVIVGLRLGIGRALTGVVVGELFASRAGVGHIITQAGQSFDTATVFFGVLIFSLMGVLLMEGLKWVEQALAPWRKSVAEVR